MLVYALSRGPRSRLLWLVIDPWDVPLEHSHDGFICQDDHWGLRTEHMFSRRDDGLCTEVMSLVGLSVPLCIQHRPGDLFSCHPYQVATDSTENVRCYEPYQRDAVVANPDLYVCAAIFARQAHVVNVSTSEQRRNGR
jgi:hypothetical protein